MDYNLTGSLTITYGVFNSSFDVTGVVTQTGNQYRGHLQTAGPTVQYFPIRGSFTPPSTVFSSGVVYVIKKEFTGLIDDIVAECDLGLTLSDPWILDVSGLSTGDEILQIDGELEIVVTSVSDGAVENSTELLDMIPKTLRPTIPKRVNIKRDPFLNMAALMGIEILPDDTNAEIRDKLYRASKDQRNSTYEGLINSVAQDLNLFKGPVLRIDPKSEAYESYDGEGVVEIDGSFIRLYSFKVDRENYDLDLEAPLRGNLASIKELADYINANSAKFYATIIDKELSPPKILMHQSNIKIVWTEFLESTTNIKLINNNIRQGSARFSNRRVFRSEVQGPEYLIKHGDYYIDYYNGFVQTMDLPMTGDYVSYKWLDWPYEIIGCDIAVNAINDRSMRRVMFNQNPIEEPVTRDPVNLTNDGTPTNSTVQLIKELLNVAKVGWGE